MAVLCLARDRADLRERLGRMQIAQTYDQKAITADQLGVVGAMLALLEDARLPNLVQTTEGAPALVHGGPFANIAHGCGSIIATNLGRRLADWVVTEAGFGMDLGGEKFFDIKCGAGGVGGVAAVVIVAGKGAEDARWCEAVGSGEAGCAGGGPGPWEPRETS